MENDYEEIIDEFLEKMELVKAPLPAFYSALRTLRNRVDSRIEEGKSLGETE